MNEPTTQTVNSTKVYEAAKAALNQHLATNAVLGCAETVNEVFTRALGVAIGGGSSTQAMYPFLQNSKRFARIFGNPLPGDVIISPTGSGNGGLDHGHVGIVAVFGILSNDSSNGALHENFTHEMWWKYFYGKGGLKVEYYRVLDDAIPGALASAAPQTTSTTVPAPSTQADEAQVRSLAFRVIDAAKQLIASIQSMYPNSK